jgi:tetratricopeptide (TPR) repeat protein
VEAANIDTKESAMSRVFISYAKEDRQISMRIYEDLKRSSFETWRYEVDGEIGVDFLEEIRRQIEIADFFCLIDSSYARKSPYIKEECRFARQLRERIGEKRGLPRFIPCSKEPDGDWRKEGLFEGQNQIRYVDFSDYEKGIKELCKSLGVNYSPFSDIPRDKDFQDEVYKITSIDIRDSQSLIDDYADFRSKYDEDKEVAESLLIRIIAKCGDLKIQLISPYLALGVLRAEGERHEDALKTFRKASTEFQNDPRVWAGIAGAQYHLSCYEEARNSYEKCRALVNQSDDESHKSHLVEVIHNLARVLVVMGHEVQALSELNHLPEPQMQHPEILTLKGWIFMNVGDLEQARKYLEKAYESDKTPSLILDLSECYERCGEFLKQYEMLNQAIQLFPRDAQICRSLAAYFINRGEWDLALSYFKKTVSLSPHEIRYRAELALLSHRIRNSADFDHQVEKSLTLPATNYTEHYYLGLIYYLIGKFERALDEYKYAKKDRKLATWPYYDELVDK